MSPSQRVARMIRSCCCPLAFGGCVGAQFHVGLAALMIVTSAGTAYRRDDGAQVAPVTTLGPWSNQSGQA